MMSGVIIAALHRTHALKTALPTISIEIRNCRLLAVPDTGAQVTVAGISYLQKCGLKESQLNKPPHSLKHVGGGFLVVVGSRVLSIKHKKTVIDELVYFVKGLETLFLSLTACKNLQLVHKSFPNVQLINDGEQIAYHQQKRLTGDSVKHHLLASNNAEICQGPAIERPPTSLPERPGKIPLPPTEGNIESLEQWLLQSFSSSTFNTKAKPLPTMAGELQHIHLIDGATPVAAHTPIPIPHHWEVQIKHQLDEDVEKGILRKVLPGTPVDWCMRMVCVPKPDGTPRRTVDFQPLNRFCKRETHLSPTPFEAVSSIPPHTYKSKTDAYNGYHQVALCPARISPHSSRNMEGISIFEHRKG